MPFAIKCIQSHSVFASLVGPVLEVRVWDTSYCKLPGFVEWLDLHNLPNIVFVVIFLDMVNLFSV